MRFFNTSGPVVAAKHYCIPPLERLDLRGILQLVGRERYFVLHAPRQTGKTSILLALKDELNRSGGYRCVYINVEVGQAAREDVGAATRSILNHTARRARSTLNDDFVASIRPEALARAGPYNAFEEVLGRWAEADERPLVLLIDEIDALIGDTLLSVLRQLRAGYDQHPSGFPQSVVLCGVRDVRDYRIHSSTGKSIVTGGSAFNIKSESLRLGDFSPQEVEALLAQHTRETGQVFDPDAGEAIWTLTRGQPWLVNALAYQACFRGEDPDRSRPVTFDVVRDAGEQLVLRRDTRLDQLADKLREERVRRVVEPVLSGETPAGGIPDDDVDYARDLGLIARDGPIRIANPIYREVVPRQLVYGDFGQACRRLFRTGAESEWIRSQPRDAPAEGLDRSGVLRIHPAAVSPSRGGVVHEIRLWTSDRIASGNVGAEMARLIDGLGLETAGITLAAARRVADCYAQWGKGVNPRRTELRRLLRLRSRQVA